MPRRDDILSKINPRYLPIIQAARAEQRRPLFKAPETIVAAPIERRIRQTHEELNKLERDYLDVLRFENPGVEILSQALRVRLGNGAWYKADHFIPSKLTAYECKGPHAFRGGFESLKIAASTHRWLKFVLVWRDKGQWFRQDVLP